MPTTRRLAKHTAAVFTRYVPAPCPPDARQIARGRSALSALDPAMAALDARIAAFEWRSRAAGFAGLVRMILGQQVSTVAADAMWTRLQAHAGEVTPAAITAMDDAQLRACGFSGQKIRYTRGLAAAQSGGTLDLAALPQLDDAAATAVLVAQKGVGAWTAEVYLMMAEGRMDVFPAGDIAVQEAIRWLDGLDARPAPAAAYVRAEAWRPWRSIAAHLLWEWYVGVKAGLLAPPELGQALTARVAA